MARKKSKKSKDKEILSNNVPDSVTYKFSEPMKVGSGKLDKDSAFSKAFGFGDTVAPLKDGIDQSPYGPFLRLLPSNRDNITIPVIGSRADISHDTLSIRLTRHTLSDTDAGLSNAIERFITQSIVGAAENHPRVPIPSDFTEIDIFHRVLRDANRKLFNDFAVAMSTKDSGTLLRMEHAVKDVVDYSANDPTSYAGIPIIPSRFIKDGDMYVVSKDTNILAFKDEDIKTEGRILAGSALTDDALIYKATDDCHTVWYEFSDETNDFCIECETCGYSYWAGNESDAIERLNDHTEDAVFIKTFRSR